MLLQEVDGKGVSMESYVFLFMQNRKKKQGIFLVHFDLATYVCWWFQIGRKAQRNYLVLFSGRKEKEILCSFHLTTYVSSLLQAERKEQGNNLIPLSSRTERKKEFFVFLLLCNSEIYLLDRRFPIWYRIARLVRRLVISWHWSVCT